MNKQVNKIIDKFSSGNYSKKTQREFYQWLIDEEHSEEKEDGLHELWLKTSSERTDETKVAYNRVLTRIDKPKRNYNLFVWRVAAAILLISTATLSFILINNKQHNEQSLIEEYTPIAQVDSIYLPDGSLVYKNAKTTLLYPSEFSGKTRSVYLIGEATFKVKKGEQPFVVKTSDLAITALGTEFNVEAYPEESYISATLLSGSIAVDDYRQMTQTILKPEQQLVYNRKNEGSTISNIDTDVVTAWIDGQIIIQNKTIYEAIKTLERRFNIDFQYNHSIIEDTDKFNFKFRRNASLEEVMKVIQTVSGTQYTIEKNTYILK